MCQKLLLINPLLIKTNEEFEKFIHQINKSELQYHDAHLQPKIISTKDPDLMAITHRIADSLGYNLPEEFFFDWRKIENGIEGFSDSLIENITNSSHTVLLGLVHYLEMDIVKILENRRGSELKPILKSITGKLRYLVLEF